VRPSFAPRIERPDKPGEADRDALAADRHQPDLGVSPGPNRTESRGTAQPHAVRGRTVEVHGVDLDEVKCE